MAFRRLPPTKSRALRELRNQPFPSVGGRETPAPVRLRRRQRQVTAFQRQIVTTELAPNQRQLASKIPPAQVVASIAPGVAGRATAAASALPMPERLIRFVPQVAPKRTTKILFRASNLPATVRHETAHHVLTLQGIPSVKHHPIISKAVVSAKEGVNFRLLDQARAAIQFGRGSQDEGIKSLDPARSTVRAGTPHSQDERLRRAKFRERRRQARLKEIRRRVRSGRRGSRP